MVVQTVGSVQPFCQIRPFDAKTGNEPEFAEVDGVHHVAGGNLFDVTVKVGLSRGAGGKHKLVWIGEDVRLRLVIIRKGSERVGTIVVARVVKRIGEQRERNNRSPGRKIICI
jgi:hypothetical protein